MPSGSEAIARKKQQKDSQKDRIDNEIKSDYFSIGGGQFAIVRFLEQGEELHSRRSTASPSRRRTARGSSATRSA